MRAGGTRNVAMYAGIAVVAFLFGALIALQPGVRRTLDASGLGRALSLSAGDAGDPDLAVLTVTAPATARVGQAVSISWSVQNRGPAPVDRAYFDGIVLSGNPSFDGAASSLGTANQQRGVASNGSYNQSATFTVPAIAPGSYFVIVRADAFNLIEESDKSNNDRAVRITVER